MAIKRRSKPFTLSTGSLTVWESSWDISMARSALEEEARTQRKKCQEQLKEQFDGSPEAQLLYFQEMIYAPLAACSTGEVPDVEQAFQLPPADLDGWFNATREVDPESFGDENAEPETVTFRDGSQITILPAYLPSVLMKLHQLETAAEQTPEQPAESIATVTFRVLYYPRLAACSIGDVPSMEDARTEWPTSELDKWYGATRRVNPRLFLPLEEIALQNKEAAEQQQKKKDRRPRKS